MNKYADYLKQPMTAAPVDEELTPASIEGPFYLPGAPMANDVIDFRPVMRDERGAISIDLSVRDKEGRLQYNVILDWWQADEEGVYDETGFTFRSKARFEWENLVTVSTVRPGHYKIGENLYRPGHIHVKIWHANELLLTTQLYFPGDPHNETDKWFNPKLLLKPGYGEVPTYSFDFVVRTP